jgi:hypothetical protein
MKPKFTLLSLLLMTYTYVVQNKSNLLIVDDHDTRLFLSFAQMTQNGDILNKDESTLSISEMLTAVSRWKCATDIYIYIYVYVTYNLLCAKEVIVVVFIIAVVWAAPCIVFESWKYKLPVVETHMNTFLYYYFKLRH